MSLSLKMKRPHIKFLILTVLCISFLSYSMVLYTTLDNGMPVAGEFALEGKTVWQQNNCQACHQLYGLGGHLGPDLTNVYSTKPEAYIRAILQTGTPVMPNFHLDKKEINALVAFFEYTNSTGKSNPKSFKQNQDGTITSP